MGGKIGILRVQGKILAFEANGEHDYPKLANSGEKSVQTERVIYQFYYIRLEAKILPNSQEAMKSVEILFSHARKKQRENYKTKKVAK